jgi:WD40 repeat protein
LLTADEQKVTRRLFLGLVKPGEGRDDTRARLPIPTDPATREIIRKFSDRRSRLLITGSENIAATANPISGHAAARQRATVEVAHEALIRNWSTLREWLDINRDRLRARSAILQSKHDWEDAGQNDNALLPEGFQLDRAKALVNDPGDVPLEDIEDFIKRSIDVEKERLDKELADELENQRRIAEAERRAREAAEAATQAAKARELTEYNSRRAADQAATVLRRWLAVVVFAGVAAIGASMFAVVAKKTASYNLQAAFLTNAEQSLIEQKPTAAHLLASSGITKDSAIWGGDWFIGRLLDVSKTHDQIVRLQSIVGLTQAAYTEPLKSWNTDGVLTSTAVSSDGSLVAFGNAGGGVYVEPTEGDKGYNLKGHKPGRIVSLQFAGTSRKLVSATATEIIVWDLETSKSQVICNGSSITEVAVDKNGDYLAWTSKDGGVSYRNLSSSSSPPASFPGHRAAMAISVSLNGELVASAGDEGNVFVRSLPGRDPVTATRIETKHSDIVSIALNEAGTRVAVASLSGAVEVWRVTNDPQQPLLVSVPADKRWRVRYSPDGKSLAVASWRGTVGFWEAEQLIHVGTIDGHQHRVNDMAFSRDSERIVTATENGVGRLWQARAIRPIFQETNPSEAGENIVGAYNDDGTAFASGGKDGITRIYTVRGSDGQLLFRCATVAQADRIIHVSPLSDKNLIATVRLAERDLKTSDVLSFWEMDHCQPGPKYGDQDREVMQGLSYDARSGVLARGDADGRIALSWSAQSGDRAWMPPKSDKALHIKSIADLAFSSDGRLLASAGNDGQLAIWNMQKRGLDHVKAGPAGRLNTVQFSPDGKFIAAGGEDKTIFVWDVLSPQPLQVLPFPGQTNRLAFSADSSMLAAGSDSREITVWSTADWKKRFQLNKLVGVRSVYGFHPKRNDLAFDGENGVVRIIPGESLRPKSNQGKSKPVLAETEINFDANRDHVKLGRKTNFLIAADPASCH